jgi:hypothetical protein
MEMDLEQDVADLGWGLAVNQVMFEGDTPVVQADVHFCGCKSIDVLNTCFKTEGGWHMNQLQPPTRRTRT